MTTSRRVQKFRSIDEMNAAQAVPSDAGDFDRFLRHCARYWALAPRVYPRGVFKFRSIEEAQRSRERQTARQGRPAAPGGLSDGV